MRNIALRRWRLFGLLVFPLPLVLLPLVLLPLVLLPLVLLPTALLSHVGFAEEAAVPRALGGGAQTPLSAQAPLSFDAAQSCQQLCSCTCPGGLVIPALPVSSAQAPVQASAQASAQSSSQYPGPTGAAAAAPADPGSANVSGTAHAGFHSAGMFGYHRPPELTEEPVYYPNAWVDRPLVLPGGLTQPGALVDFFNDSTNNASPLHERVLIGSETGIGERWQVGGAFSGVITPHITFDSLYATGQYLLNPLANARLEMGLRHSVCPDGSSSYSGGLGLPAKLKLSPHLALISGRPGLGAFQQDDLFSWDAKSCGTAMTLGLPLGWVATLGDIFNFAVRSGYRHLFDSGAGADFIPLAFDFSIVIGGQADIGISLLLPDSLGTPGAPELAQSTWFEQRLTVFAQTRL